MKLLDRIRESLAKVLRVPEGQAPPVAIVWTDATGEWLSLAPMMRELDPGVLHAGSFSSKRADRAGDLAQVHCGSDSSPRLRRLESFPFFTYPTSAAKYFALLPTVRPTSLHLLSCSTVAGSGNTRVETGP